MGTTSDFCILTTNFINYIRIYFERIPRFRSAYFKNDFNNFKKDTITFDNAYNLNFKTYATFILKQINSLFENKIAENFYTDYNNKDTIIPSNKEKASVDRK